jgi:hypothetical protein
MKLTKIFWDVDNYCKKIENSSGYYLPGNKLTMRMKKNKMHLSEILTIIIFFIHLVIKLSSNII